MKKIVGGLVGVAALITLTGCSSVSTAPDQAAVQYDGGVFIPTSHKFLSCAGPSHQGFTGPGNSWYYYPAGQRTWRFGGGAGADAPAIRIVTKDNVTMTVEGVLTFNLNTNCDVLRKFHESIGIKHQPIMDDNGKTDKGWVDLISTYIDQPLRNAVSEAASTYGYRELYNGASARDAFEQVINRELPGKVKTAAGQEFFQNFSVTVQKPEAPEAIVTALEAEQAAVAQNNAQKAKNATITTELDSIKQLVAVLGPEGYIQYKALQDGRVTVLPVPQGANINVSGK